MTQQITSDYEVSVLYLDKTRYVFKEVPVYPDSGLISQFRVIEREVCSSSEVEICVINFYMEDDNRVFSVSIRHEDFFPSTFYDFLLKTAETIRFSLKNRSKE